jgi:hypothetical protein
VRENEKTAYSSCRRVLPEILINRFAANAEISGKVRRFLSGSRAAAQLSGPLWRQ